jgi:hypothetical protein
MKKETIISTSGSANLFQRFMQATLWDGHQDTRPESVSLFKSIELVESDSGELMAIAIPATYEDIPYHCISWIKRLESIKVNPSVQLEIIVRETPEISPLEVLKAYQHFLYYFDQVTFKEANIFGQTLTDHFLGKLSMYRKIHSPEGYNSLAVLVTWVQNMTDHYQAQLMEEYILKFHSNKW